jgi:ABC-2 type transport system ATP-binding protein
LLQSGGTMVRATEPESLVAALTRHGIACTGTDGALRVDAEAAQVARIALEERIVLTGLSAADGGGLEDLFLQLTADTQREGVAS